MRYVLLVFAFAATSFCAAQAQGLIGVAPEYILGRSNDQALRADQAYEMWKVASVAATCLIAVAAGCYSAQMVRRNGKAALTKAALVAISAPTCIYVFGTVLVNNLWRWF